LKKNCNELNDKIPKLKQLKVTYKSKLDNHALGKELNIEDCKTMEG
jgi:hypothetical protein